MRQRRPRRSSAPTSSASIRRRRSRRSCLALASGARRCTRTGSSTRTSSTIGRASRRRSRRSRPPRRRSHATSPRSSRHSSRPRIRRRRRRPPSGAISDAVALKRSFLAAETGGARQARLEVEKEQAESARAGPLAEADAIARGASAEDLIAAIAANQEKPVLVERIFEHLAAQDPGVARARKRRCPRRPLEIRRAPRHDDVAARARFERDPAARQGAGPHERGRRAESA